MCEIWPLGGLKLPNCDEFTVVPICTKFSSVECHGAIWSVPPGLMV